MHPPVNPLASYAMSDYLLVLEPHEALRTDIMDIKKKFAAGYECPIAAHGKPHITLVRFHQYDMLETRIVQRLKAITLAQASFMVELEDFGSFPTHTIYIQVKTKVQIVELVRSFRPVQQLMKMDKEHKPHFITEPHLTVARKLLPWQYEKGWLEYSNSHFAGKFMADHLLLLRKRLGEKRYETVQRFGLMNVKREVTQTTLFF